MPYLLFCFTSDNVLETIEKHEDNVEKSKQLFETLKDWKFARKPRAEKLWLMVLKLGESDIGKYFEVNPIKSDLKFHSNLS